MNYISFRPKISGKEIVNLLIEYTYLAIIFLIPIWFAVFFPTYNIFELNKIILFRVLVLVLFSLTLIKVVLYHFSFSRQSVKLLLKSWIIPIMFILGLGFTLLFSINPVQSFFGSYERQQGLISYLFYFLWFILLAFNIAEIKFNSEQQKSKNSLTKRIERLIITATISGFLVAVYGVLQIFKIDFLFWPESPYLTHRVLSTFGQPNFLASFLLLIIPLNLYLWSYFRSFTVRLFFSINFLVTFICLLLTSSRGALIALALVAFIFIIYLLLSNKINQLKKRIIIFTILLMLVLGFVSLEIFLPGRLISIFDYQSGSFAARVNFYSAAADSILKKPVFGYGLENGGEQFIKYYQPDWGIYGDVNASTDRAHNLLLDILLTSGIWGLIFFILFYYNFFLLAWKNIKKNKNSSLSLALALGAAGYLLSLMFGFSVVAGEVYFWLFLGLLVILNWEELDLAITSKIVLGGYLIIRKIIALLIILATLWLVYGNLKILIADHYFNRLYYLLAQEEYYTSLLLDEYIRQVGTIPTNQYFYDRFLGKQLAGLYPQIRELTTQVAIRDKLITILTDLPDKGYENMLTKAEIHAVLGDFNTSKYYFSLVISQTPHWPQGYLEMAKMFVLAQDSDSAIASFHSAEMNLPDFNDERLVDRHREAAQYYRYVIYLGLGNLYFHDVRYDLAEKYYQLAYLDNPQDFTLFKKIADTYYWRHDLNQAIEYNIRGFNRSPNDYNWPLALAVLYYEQGDKIISLEYLEQALRLAPDNEKLHQLYTKYKN